MGKIEVSQKRIEANRRNAARSSGPRTPEGKAASRANSLVHGLAGAGVVRPEGLEESLARRKAEWAEILKPTNGVEQSLVDTVAGESLRIERCRLEQQLRRDRLARQSAFAYRDALRIEVEHLGATLAAAPQVVALQLAGTAAGCDWLLARWRVLVDRLDAGGGWTDQEAALAADLLGIAADLRNGPGPLRVPDGADAFEHLAAVVEAEIRRLVRRKDEALDAVEADGREAAMRGLGLDDDPELRRLARYEAACKRRMDWAIRLIDRSRAGVPLSDPPARSRPGRSRTRPAASPPPPPPEPPYVPDEDDEEFLREVERQLREALADPRALRPEDSPPAEGRRGPHDAPPAAT